MAELLGVDDTLNSLVACVCAALESDGRPTCECGTTIGSPAISICCECEPGVSGELWGSLVRVYRAGRTSYDQATLPQRPCAPADWAAEYRLTLARCFPTIDEDGDLPSAEDRSAAAAALHADVATMHRAMHCCQDVEPPQVVSIEVQTDPSGGCSFLVATVRAPVSLSAPKNALP